MGGGDRFSFAYAYGPGFTDERGKVVRVFRERDVFDLVGLPYEEPEDRK